MNSTTPDDINEQVRDIITNLLIQTSRQHRVSVVVAAAFSVVASIFVIGSIIYDAYAIKAGQVYSRAQWVAKLYSKGSAC